ncbi:hypothetical protein P43SY_009912 [Pythium insidiosum]|uniref:DUF1279 domain-containing protein n=1 Tax=Pythium insidiosum TaxID=114742 RepID=A0AAD5LJQ3_PYTIN|nr:hypothetical protein P43SY_009912 [Pythium insidiosum]KAJ0404511.1 hypothetical protein ATCC90586_007768 [Pythium insidiosum]
MQDKVKHVLRTYGRTALAFHASLFVTTLSGSYAAIRYGLDIQTYLKKVPFIDLSKMDPDAGSLMLAYVSTLATGPARGALTIGVSPLLARWLARRHRAFAPVTKKPPISKS